MSKTENTTQRIPANEVGEDTSRDWNPSEEDYKEYLRSVSDENLMAKFCNLSKKEDETAKKMKEAVRNELNNRNITYHPD